MGLRSLIILAFITRQIVLFAQSPIQHLPLIQGIAGDTTIGVIQSFTIYDREFTPDDTIYVHWVNSDKIFRVYGRVKSISEDATFNFSFGSRNVPLIQVNQDGSLYAYAPELINSFTIAGLLYTCRPDATNYFYNVSTQEEYVFGTVDVTIDGSMHKALMGSEDHPGAIFRSNRLVEIVVQVKDTISFKELASQDTSRQSILIKRFAGYPDNTYYGHGSWWIYLNETVQYAVLGSSAQPGIVIKNGRVDSIQMTVAGGGFLWDALPIMDQFNITYHQDKAKYAITGMLTVGVPFSGLAKTLGGPNIPSFEIDAGDASHAGFLYDVGSKKFTVEDAVFILKSVGLQSKTKTQESVSINNITIGVKQNLPDSFYFRLTTAYGISLEASLSFTIHPQDKPGHRFSPHSIEFYWEAKTTEDSYPIGETGLYLVRMGGGITDLSKGPEYWTIIADVGVTLGKGFQFNPSQVSGIKLPFPKDKSVEIAFAYVEGELQLSFQGISLDLVGDIYAYFKSGQWSGIYGSMDLDIDASFTSQTLNLKAGVSTFAPPFDYLDASLAGQINKAGDFEGLGTVQLQIPPEIPIIGGKKLAKASGAVHHSNLAVDNSYAAGWTKIRLPFDHMNIGIKTNFKNGNVSKIGAGEERSIKSEITSDTAQHPASDGQVMTDWHLCEINKTFSIEVEKPAAYLQNELIFDKRIFADPSKPNTYLTPVSANIEPPSGSNDLKSMLPDDSLGIYLNNGQTTRPYHAVDIDLSKSNKNSHLDTIRWVTVNHNVGSYSAIDWINQPMLMLTPGEQVLTVSGYCATNSPPLTDSSIIYNVSPVFPRPVISMVTDPVTRRLTIDYSAYLTDSTAIIVYWNGTPEYSGKVLAHLNYYQGTRIGDSTYRWVIEDWNPGILTQSTIYLYAGIDDFVNAPEYSTIDSVFFEQNISGTAAGVKDSAVVLLSRVDSTEAVHAILIPTSDPAGVRFGYYNMPLGKYSLSIYNTEQRRSLISANVSSLDGETKATLRTPQWIAVDFTVDSWDNGIAHIDFNSIAEPINLYGNVIDTAGETVDNYKIFLLPTVDAAPEHLPVSDLGFTATQLESGYVTLAILLPEGNQFHWPITSKQKYFQSDPSLFGLALYMDSILISEVPNGINFNAIEGPQGPIFLTTDLDNHPISGVLVSVKKADGTGPTEHALTNQDGLAYFEAEEIELNKSYIINYGWPQNYAGITASGQPFVWLGTETVIPAVGKLK